MACIMIDGPCTLCGDCVAACEEKALTQDEETGGILLNEEKCNCCGDCVDVCPANCIVRF